MSDTALAHLIVAVVRLEQAISNLRVYPQPMAVSKALAEARHHADKALRELETTGKEQHHARNNGSGVSRTDGIDAAGSVIGQDAGRVP